MVGAAARNLFLTALFFLGAVPAVQAQTIGVAQSEILVLDTERFLAHTLIGQQLLADLQAEREARIIKNRQIEAGLEAEEKALTEMREEKSAEEFRDLADAFNERVQKIRRESERAAADLERQRELIPRKFMQIVEPVLVDLMRDAGGRVILDQRGVLLRLDGVDITDAAIARVNERIGNGQAENPPE